MSKSHVFLHDRGTVSPNIDEGPLGPAVWSGLLGKSLLNVAPAVTCAYPRRPKLEPGLIQHVRQICSYLDATCPPITYFSVSEWEVAHLALSCLCIRAYMSTAGTQQQAVQQDVEPMVNCRFQPPLRFGIDLLSWIARLHLYSPSVRNLAYHLPDLPTFFRPPSISTFHFAKSYLSHYGNHQR